MKSNKILFVTLFLILTSLLFSCSTNKAIENTTKKFNSENKYPIEWNIKDVYENDEAWYKDFELVEKEIPKLSSFRGTLHSAKGIYDFVKFSDDGELTYKLNKLKFYVNLKTSLNNIDEKANTMQAQLDELSTKMNQQFAFVDEEIYKMDLEERKKIFSDPILKDYAYSLRNYTDEKTKHKSEETENYLAYMYPLLGSGYEIYNILSNTELVYPTIEMPDGTKEVLNNSVYDSIFRGNYDHDFKLKASNLFFSVPKNNVNTFAKTLNSTIKENVAMARMEGFDTYKEYAFHELDIEPEIYEKIKASTRAMLPTFHKYIKYMKKELSYDHLYYFDINAGITILNKKITYDEACEQLLNALSIYGDDYINAVKQIIEKNHVDVYEKNGKTSGAFETSCYLKDINPYILLNYSENLYNVSTLCHEMGHAMYAYHSEHNDQLNLTNNAPSIFTHEVTSITNENLNAHYGMKNAKDKTEYNAYLESILNNIHTCIIRQMMYSEFEEYCYDIVENGGALSSNDLNKKWMELNHEYYGEDTDFPENFEYRWSQIPHMYYGFYVYKYATSCTYALATSEKLLSGDENAKKNYLKFLTLGGSDKPSKLLKIAGVDPLSDSTYKTAQDTYNKLVEERMSK